MSQHQRSELGVLATAGQLGLDISISQQTGSGVRLKYLANNDHMAEMFPIIMLPTGTRGCTTPQLYSINYHTAAFLGVSERFENIPRYN